jgi:uncharacterized protein YdaU (DUF1376 family)
MKQVKFVQLESGAFLTDVDFITMTAEQRGVYITLILFLNCNNGKCRFDEKVLSALCNCGDFAAVWEKIKHKFGLRNGWIRHKRVSHELKAAKKRLKNASEKGLKGAAKRWHSHSPANSPAIANERKRNEKEGKDISNTNTTKPSSSFSNPVRSRSLMFNDALVNIIQPRSQSDRTCFRNVTNWLVEGCASGRFDERIFERVLDYAKEARSGRRPAAVFMALMKKELNYGRNQ